MRQLVATALVLGLCTAMTPAYASDSGAAPSVTTAIANHSASMVHVRGHGPRWGHRVQGRWWAGWQAPGGWAAYRRPVFGYVLPGFWISPNFYIADFGYYGLPAPAYGYGWSRYYDDAVLTDRYGRVQDVRYSYDWDRFGGYDDRYNGYDDGVLYRQVGRGRLPPPAGMGRGYVGMSYPEPVDSVTIGGRPVAYEGRWVGTWYGDDGSTYSGAYEGRFDGERFRHKGRYRPARPAPALPYEPLPAYQGHGYGVSGYHYQPAPAVIHHQEAAYVAPTVTTTTYITEEIIYTKAHAARKKAAYKPRKAAARARPACTCTCVCR